MNNIFFIIIVISFFVLTYLAGQYLGGFESRSESVVQLRLPDCSPAKTTCGVVFDEGEITVHFHQPPSALTPFDVEVVTQGFDAEKVSVAFIMNAMDMGVNAFNLNQQSAGVWQAKVILPICSLGRSDWIAEIRIKHEDRLLRLDLPFEQI